MMKSLRPLTTPLMILLVYGVFLIGTLWLMQVSVGWRRTHIIAHLVVLSIGFGVCLVPYSIFRTRAIRRLSLISLGFFVALQTLTMAGSLLANRFIHQNISFELVRSNSAIIFDFAAPVLVLILLGGILFWGLAVAGAFLRVLIESGTRRVGMSLSLFPLILGVAGLANMTPLHFSQEPLANFVGYPGFNVLSGSFKERIDEELALGRSYSPERIDNPSNVIIMMVDSLSTKHFPLLGYSRPTTPNIQRIADSVPHHRVYPVRSTCSDSICGIVSTLTSRDILDFASGRAFKISDALQAHGYKTNLILASDHEYDPLLNFFFRDSSDYRYDKNNTETPLNSDDIILEGLELVPDSDGMPNFFFIFMFSTHQAGEKRPEYQKYAPVVSDDTAYRRERSLSDDEQVGIQNLYDNRMLQLDHYVGEVWSQLESKGYLDDALVVIIGDHGEAIGEHGYYGHGMQLYEPFVMTPLVMLSTRWPLPDPGPRMIRQIDLAPTILDFVGAPSPDFWDGASLFADETPERTFHEFGIRLRLRGLSCDAVVMNGPKMQKYIRCNRGNSPVQRYFFELADDPLEENNLIDTLAQQEVDYWDGLLNERRRVN